MAALAVILLMVSTVTVIPDGMVHSVIPKIPPTPAVSMGLGDMLAQPIAIVTLVGAVWIVPLRMPVANMDNGLVVTTANVSQAGAVLIALYPNN